MKLRINSIPVVLKFREAARNLVKPLCSVVEQFDNPRRKSKKIIHRRKKGGVNRQMVGCLHREGIENLNPALETAWDFSILRKFVTI